MRHLKGVIPKGQYGGGEVILWDMGTYASLNEDLTIAEQLDEGYVTVWLEDKVFFPESGITKGNVVPITLRSPLGCCPI
ncbi:MAG: DNA polymerase ligase N-terminal domain-containing protein [Actinomycetota bacterium]